MLALFSHLNYWLAALLLLTGLHGMLLRPHLVKKLMAMNLMQVAVIVFFISLAAKAGGVPPIALEAAHLPASAYVNPLPHALMLTAIVVSLSTTGVALALLLRIYRRCGTLEEPEILESLHE
ncbi:MAG: Na+/H+ antiporter subunit C [Candidatus Tectimicrobiota bacterium]|nr:MAG: Na+/H+ antiporter subunit C [Candidatus Tectomicrobia bacterium]